MCATTANLIIHLPTQSPETLDPLICASFTARLFLNAVSEIPC